MADGPEVGPTAGAHDVAGPFDLSTTFAHLGLDASVIPVPEFSFRPDAVRRYLVRFARDRDEGRLVGMLPMVESWGHWERHVNGDELVVVLSGSCDIVQEVGDGFRTHRMGPGDALVNPRGVWHTSDVHEAGSTLFVAAGRRTDYRDR
ncbi:cupin domain-containing protein [Kribbella sp. NPDC050820]|uniref:cupin domain-containing protein n=1 Tax=Kribbella sp. NPDC050820 TaxID=3155408 RepID=UPI00340A9963